MKKIALSKIYSELILDETMNFEDSILLKNEEYQSLFNTINSKEKEISKYRTKIESLENIIQNLESQYSKIVYECKNKEILNQNLLENTQILQTGLASNTEKEMYKKKILNNETRIVEKVSEANNNNAEKLKILTLENENIKQQLLNTESKNEELKKVIQAKENLILNMKKEVL